MADHMKSSLSQEHSLPLMMPIAQATDDGFAREEAGSQEIAKLYEATKSRKWKINWVARDKSAVDLRNSLHSVSGLPVSRATCLMGERARPEVPRTLGNAN
ncbi:hypothetical protein PoB_001068200 [Plakobranchus ocellatus]|uniref:Uncharacterized protein n=1 Tax=Plakobranchus ocellatus TaxID=259542 RepID=A0AAV3YP20_9GAST|nr:hypothetical protein PoB_001068200 [Plakobranchus ocellatus]